METRNSLLIGLGGFGKNHLGAWHDIGQADHLWVAEVNPAQHAVAASFNFPRDRISTDHRAFLKKVDAVDVVVPTTIHHTICREALQAGKDVFVEKPMTMTAKEAEELRDLAEKEGRVIQVGYYYRYHPISLWVHQQIRKGAFGPLRYINGHFMGFKRARTDVGVTHTDAVHFIDLFNWWIGQLPTKVYAIARDHWGRKMDDLSIVHFEYPGGTDVLIESGYIQPGRWKDKVVPDAVTSKDAFVCGEKATAELDFETEEARLHRVHHEPRNGTWWPTNDGTLSPNLGTLQPRQMIARELTAFLDASKTRRGRGPGPVASGVVIARQVEAIYRSAANGAPEELTWTTAESTAIAGEGPTA